MVVFPPVKINLGLYVTKRREDGFHNIESIFVPVAFTDVLEVVENDRDEFRLFMSGLPVPGDADSNLVRKAYDILNEQFALPGVDCYLHKIVPTGAGLGGGSSDGAFMLRLLKAKFDLPISNEQLMKHAATLGSDCPFFIQDSACNVKGRGEILEPAGFSLRNKWIVLINPGIHVSTRQAFGLIEPNTAPAGWMEKLISAPYTAWQKLAVNDFEAPVKRLYPEIADILESLKKAGAFYVSMTGSGSTCYGIFHQSPDVGFDFPENYLIKLVKGI
ncbi:MAG: 4-(cytidine 5'-diphospho)-2-C-methyl-D-erythritol kinase [Bacteroidia bacterium]